MPGWERPVEPYIEPDGEGGLWTTDPGSAEAVLHFARTGKVTERRTVDDQEHRFSLPTGLALDSKSRVLYVVNSGSGTISKISIGAAGGEHP